jgi:hypothetical protein
VQVARLLGGLPAMRAAFGAGELCFSQVRAIARVATPENETELVQIARYATAGQLETIVRCDHDEDGSLLLRARLPADEGALVLAALTAGRDALRERTAAGSAEIADAGVGPVVGGSASAEATHIGDTVARDPWAWDGVGEDPEAANVLDEDAWVPDGDPTPLERGAGGGAGRSLGGGRLRAVAARRARTQHGRARERGQCSALRICIRLRRRQMPGIAGAARRRFAAAERERICGGDH